MEGEHDRREKAYTFIAYSAITFSLVAIFSVCVTLPMVYNYVNNVHGNIRQEARFCKASVKDAMMEISDLRTGISARHTNHTMVKHRPAAATAADRACPDPADGQARTAPPARPDNLDRPASPDHHRRSCADRRQAPSASPAHQAAPETQEPLETQERTDAQETLDVPAALANQAMLDPPDHLDPAATQDAMDLVAHPASRPSLCHPPPETLDSQETTDHPEPQETTAPQVATALPAGPDPVALLDNPETQAVMAPLESQETRARPDNAERTACAPRTAPTTEAPSSRTAPADKHPHPYSASDIGTVDFDAFQRLSDVVVVVLLYASFAYSCKTAP